MSRRTNKTRFNVAECINDIVDHIDFSTHSYHNVAQVDLYRIDLRDIPGLPKEEFFKGFEGYCRPPRNLKTTHSEL